MNRLLLKLAITAAVGSLLSSNPTIAQLVPNAKRAARVEITKGPALELADDHSAIIRWTTNDPGGPPVRYAVVHYGTDRDDLSQTAKNPINLNRDHPETIFRVRVGGLQPRTIYYYRATSTESDGVESPVKHFANR